MSDFMKYFKGSALVTAVGIILGYMIGGLNGALICAILGVLEVSLSFDNAVVNATVLKDMSEKWRHRFITWGMFIAVFGMRVVFPLLIVAVTAKMWPVDNPLTLFNPILEYFGYLPYEHVTNVLTMAITKPEDYEAALTSSHIMIAGFGGAFLFMVFLEFFIDDEKDVHWLGALEAPITTLAKYDAIHIFITLAAAYGFSFFLAEHEATTFFYSAVAGIAAHTLATWLGVWLEHSDEPEEIQSHDGTSLPVIATKSGLASFMYLELLDASFSFDGVIGAFALSNNIFIIAIGLGIGAMFVRSLTIMFVEKETLEQFRYLEHGAFYAIAALAIIMFAGTIHEIPEVVTGLIGAGFITFALIASVMYNKKMSETTSASETA